MLSEALRTAESVLKDGLRELAEGISDKREVLRELAREAEFGWYGEAEKVAWAARRTRIEERGAEIAKALEVREETKPEPPKPKKSLKEEWDERCRKAQEARQTEETAKLPTEAIVDLVKRPKPDREEEEVEEEQGEETVEVFGLHPVWMTPG